MTAKNGHSAEAPDEVAIEALSFVAGDPVIFNRFLRLTGLELENLRAAASEPAFLAGVLDFLLSDERLVLAFSDQSAIDPSVIADARRRLGSAFALEDER